ncbi:uncharacterized protein I303_100530 [Kwoniella dejecticola CBS 10117]|uniref:Extracellular membrane protein CFEM domain-containing protein n=1 Tax=Kwoniella dejecticola CBS 10117 TaxID=1296121 RepID=A0A1A6AF87_9TREE|nr:uncharacterized protein I303_00531 [Kwoniella dejecticola CBS 10117]OBR88714.1 hypothetical protein I303_00531 [Kwoniella dejecticola CBS 10117]
MFGLVALVPVLGAISAAAISPEVMRMIPRQSSIADAFPAACQSQCTGAIQIYNACLNSDYNTCLTVCKQDTFNDFVGCFQCVLDNTSGVSQSEWTQLQSAVDQIKSGCSQSGQSVTGGLQALSGTATPTAAGGGSYSTIHSSGGGGVVGGTFTSAASGLTIAASSAAAAANSNSVALGPSAASTSIGGPISAGEGPSTSAGGASAGSASSAAASAAAPGSGALPVTSFVGGFVSLVAVAAGMAIAL